MAQMLDFRERFRLRKAIYAKPTIILLAFLVLFTARGAWGMYEKSIEATANRNKAVQDLHVLENRKQELDQDISRLSSDRGIEEEIRDRFMVAKEGEKVMIVVAPQTKGTHTIVVPEERTSFMDRVLGAVGLSYQ